MSFAELLKRISPTLKRITYRLNRHSGFLNEEDLYQEAVLNLWQDFQKGGFIDKTDSYILQGCYFYLKNYLRKAKIFAKIISLETIVNEEGANLEEVLYLKGEDGKYLDNLNNKLLAETIRNNGLTRREKNILNFYADGLTTRQIGTRLGVSHVRVVKLMAVIREKCRRYDER